MIARASVLSAIVCLGTTASAQELPPQEVLQERVAETLPGYWHISEFRVIATSDIGDAVQPRRAVRFEADAAPTAPLFAQAGAQDPYVLVVPTGSADEIRTLYGVLDLSYRAGLWTSTVQIENPVGGLGQPLALFASPVLELGSAETEAKLAAIRDQEIGASIAAMERELAAKREEHAAAIAAFEIASAKELEQAKRTQAKKAAETEARLAAEVAALKARYRTELSDLTSSNEPLVAEALAERERLLSAEREASTTALQAQKTAATADLEKLIADHARARGELIAKQTQELAELETGLATERRSLERQLAAAQDVIALQKQLAAALAERALGTAPLFAAFESDRQKKREFLAKLPREWRGTVSCKDTAGEGLVDFDEPRLIMIEEIRSEGFYGKIGPDGYSTTSAEFLIAENGFFFPVKFDATLYSTNYIKYGINGARTFPVEIQQDGQMIGGTSVDWNINGVSVNVTCRLRLSN